MKRVPHQPAEAGAPILRYGVCDTRNRVNTMNLLLGGFNRIHRVAPGTERTSAVTIDLAANIKTRGSGPLRALNIHFSEQVVTAVRVKLQPEYTGLTGSHPSSLGKRRRSPFG